MLRPGRVMPLIQVKPVRMPSADWDKAGDRLTEGIEIPTPAHPDKRRKTDMRTRRGAS